jgi:hypothetical protein
MPVARPATTEDVTAKPRDRRTLAPGASTDTLGIDPAGGAGGARPGHDDEADPVERLGAGAANAGDDGGWIADVSTDAAWYARFCEAWKATNGHDCPIEFPGAFARTVALDGPVIIIGRHAAGIDLAQEPNDAAVSHRHASLIRQSDGAYALTDLDSSNGTYAASGPVAQGQTVALHDGDHFNVGAFTRITVRRTHD